MKEWIKEEAKQMKLSDKRLVERYKKLLGIMTEKPNSSIPQACNSFAETKAAYRFFDNENVESQAIRNAFYLSTASRIKGQKIVLIPTDTTNLNFSSHAALKGRGVLTNWAARGLLLHSSLAVDSNGTPLGLLFQKCWGRKSEDYGKKYERTKMPIEKRESFKWIESLRGIQQHLPDETMGIVITDREADLYDYFAENRNPNCHILLRAKQTRTLVTGDKLFEKLASLKPVGTFKITIKKNRGLEERKAELEVRFSSEVVLPPKTHSHKGFSPISINIISATEINSLIAEPVEWILLTTLPINSFEDAVQSIKWYSMRWIIERYHYTLKSGCQIEELQLEESERIDRAAAVYCVVAWRLMYVTYLGRNEPENPASMMLEKVEWEALYSFVNKGKKPPKQPPSNKEAVLLIARLGGFNNRKSDGNPGLKVVWHGLRRLKDISASYSLWGKRCG